MIGFRNTVEDGEDKKRPLTEMVGCGCFRFAGTCTRDLEFLHGQGGAVSVPNAATGRLVKQVYEQTDTERF